MKEIDEVDVVNDIFGPEVQDRFLKYTITPSSSNNCFYGNNYKIQDLTASSGIISVQRQGGFTTAILSMLLEEENGKPKYTIDQLFDPNQFQKEKQAKFDEVVKRSRNASDSGDKTMAESPDGKWIVETLYKGMKRLNDIIDETAEKIDFTNDDFIYSEEFAKIIGLSGISFDAWQEINRFDKMRHEVVLADKPEFTTEASRRNHIDNLSNPLSSTYQKMRKVFESHNKVKDGNDITVSTYISSSLHLNYVKDMMRDWKKSGKKLSQYLIDTDANAKFTYHTDAADKAMRDMVIAFATGHKLQVVVDKRIQDGSLIKNIEYDEKNATFINFPQLNEDESDFDIEEMELDEASAQKGPKSVKEIVASKDTWYPWFEKIRERFSKVHASLSPIADYYSDATDLVIELVQLKSNPSKGIETIKKLVDFLHKKEGDKTLYETFAEGMKPGELYGLLDDIDKAFGGVLDMDSIGELSPKDKSAYEAFKKAEEESFKPGDEYAKRVFKYAFSNNQKLKKSFLGNKYTIEMLRDKPKYHNGSISLDRTGGHSIAALNLLAMKDEEGNRIYSFDDVFNPKKFQKVKQEEFDKVVEHSIKAGARKSNRKNKSSRWLVDNIYNSIKEAVKIIDELAENIDFDDENFDKSEEYLQINLLGNIVFDAWQEICTFPDLMDEKLKADYPKLNKDQRYDAFQDILGPITSIGNEMIMLADEHNRLKNHKTGAYMDISKYLYSAIKQKPAAEMFKEWHEKGKGKTLTQYFRDNKFGAKYHLMNFAANTAIEPMVDSCYENHHREKKLDNLFMTGELFKNVTYIPGKGKKEGVFHNVPTYDIKKEQVVFPEIKIDKKAAKKASKKGASKASSKKAGKIIEENLIKEPVGKSGKTTGIAASKKAGKTADIAASKNAGKTADIAASKNAGKTGKNIIIDDTENIIQDNFIKLDEIDINGQAGKSGKTTGIAASKNAGKTGKNIIIDDTENIIQDNSIKLNEIDIKEPVGKSGKTTGIAASNKAGKTGKNIIIDDTENIIEDNLGIKLEEIDIKEPVGKSGKTTGIAASNKAGKTGKNIIIDDTENIIEDNLGIKLEEIDIKGQVGKSEKTTGIAASKNAGKTGKNIIIDDTENIIQDNSIKLEEIDIKEPVGKSGKTSDIATSKKSIINNEIIINIKSEIGIKEKLIEEPVEEIIEENIIKEPTGKSGKIIEENHIKEPVGKSVKTAAKAASKKTGPTIATRHGEDIPVNEVLRYLQALKQTAGEARGLFYDSPEYINFYMAIDDVTKAARDLKKNKNTNIINEDHDRLQNYKRAVDRLKDFAEDYENYKMADHTTDKTREPDKKALNSDDKRKLKIMKNVLHNNRYFNVDAPKLTNEEFLIKSERALARLKKDTYTSKRQYIEDSAYAMFGQMYRVNKDSGEPINLQEVMQEKIASGEFEKNLKSKKNPHGYISPKDVAKKAENKERMREMAAAIKKERTNINSNIIPDHPKRTTTQKEQTIKNPSKN